MKRSYSSAVGITFLTFLAMTTSIFPNVVSGDPDCIKGFDVVQIQDMTLSFDKLWIEMANQVDGVMNLIESTGPDSKFGFSTFGDKPLSGQNAAGKKTTLGYATDYCFHVDASLDKPDADAMVQLFTQYHTKAAGGGGDWSENVYGGIHRALLSSRLGWRQSKSYRDNQAYNEVFVPVVVVVTDALAHFKGEVGALTSIEVRPNDISAAGMEAHGNDENYDCDKVDYPSIEQLVELIQTSNVQLIILAAPGGTYDANGNFSPAASLAKKGKQYRQPDGLAKYYNDTFTKQGVKVFTAQLDPEMTAYYTAFEDAFNKMTGHLCPTTTTTTTTSTSSTTSTTSTSTSTTSTTDSTVAPSVGTDSPSDSTSSSFPSSIASATISPVPFFAAGTDNNGIGSECFARSHETPATSPQWTSEFIYPIEVCAAFQGTIQPCTPLTGADGDSKMILSVLSNGKEVTSLEGKFIFEKKAEVGTKLYCSTFSTCAIAEKLSSISAVNISDIELVGKVEVTGARRIRDKSVEDPKLQALMRFVGIAVPEKVSGIETYESDLSANYAVVRKGTFCEEDYECITKVGGSKASMTTTTRKMMLLKDKSIPTCTFKDNDEGTKLHLTILSKSEDVCGYAKADPDCNGKVIIEDKSGVNTSDSPSEKATSSSSSEDSSVALSEEGTRFLSKYSTAMEA